jgi:acetylornithine deacetylase/succinyl-diaminopimelate desuccinylase-like protein
MDVVTAARRRARARRESTLGRLVTLIRYPTVSADPRHAADLAACAAWLARLLGHIGLVEVRVSPGQVAPVVTAAWRGAPGLPTLLVYGHYDVQPTGPRSAWATDPFRATRADSYLHGRGASDDKGQLMAHLAAIEAWLATSGRLPLNLTVVLDGEEEIGSPTLLTAVRRGWAPLTADAALVSDTWMLAPDAPVVISGLRGAIRARLEVSGPWTDLHAGSFGGAVANPAHALARLVAGLHEKSGRVAVAGFYDGVRPLSGAERDRLARTAPSDARLLEPAGEAAGHGEPGFSAFERVTRRPALVVTDVSTSSGGRTVVPARAAADLNLRLAAGQEPGPIARALRRHIQARVPAGVRARLLVSDTCPPYTLDRSTPVIRGVRAACRTVFGRDPVLLPSGGSIPFVSTLAAAGGIHVMLLGFGLPADRVHAPNERLYLPNLFRGTDTCIELYQQLAGELRAGALPSSGPPRTQHARSSRLAAERGA